jgi:hypothetical protein
MIKIVEADIVRDKIIRLRFSEGTNGDYDLAPLIDHGTVMVQPLENDVVFRRFFLELGALCPPNGFALSGRGIQQRLRELGQLHTVDQVACPTKAQEHAIPPIGINCAFLM